MSISWSGQQILDPSEIEARFSVTDGMAYMNSIFDEPSEESARLIDRVRDILEQLPPREADFVSLYYFQHLKQTDIAGIFRVSQPTVCYRLQRATARIQFLLKIPVVDQDKMRAELLPILPDPKDVDIVIMMCNTTCQSVVAKKLNVSQGLVRHRFIRSIGKMRRHPHLQEYVHLLEEIAQNLNIRREVRRNSCDCSDSDNIIHVID